MSDSPGELGAAGAESAVAGVDCAALFRLILLCAGDLALVAGLTTALITFLCVTTAAAHLIRRRHASQSVHGLTDLCKLCM